MSLTAKRIARLPLHWTFDDLHQIDREIAYEESGSTETYEDWIRYVWRRDQPLSPVEREIEARGLWSPGPYCRKCGRYRIPKSCNRCLACLDANVSAARRIHEALLLELFLCSGFPVTSVPGCSVTNGA